MESRISEEKQNDPLDVYARILEQANEELHKLTGGMTAHLRWFEKQHPANADVIKGFILQVANSPGKIPLCSYKTLCGLWVAMQRHIWTCWLVRDLMPADVCFLPGFDKPN